MIQKRRAILVLGCAVAACSGGAGSVGTNGGAAVVGQERGSDPRDVVTPYAVDAQGHTTVIGDGAHVDATGHYTLRAQLPSDAAALLLVSARDGERVGAVFITSAADAQGVIRPAPIDLRSTFDADAALAARPSDAWVGVDTVAALRALVTTDVAAAARVTIDDMTDVQLVAAGGLAAASAFARALAVEGRATSEQLTAASHGTAAALAALDVRLAASSASVDEEAAVAAFIEARQQAYVDAGVSLEHFAAATHSGCDAALLYLGRSTSRAATRLRVRVERVRAAALLALARERARLLDGSGAFVEAEARLQADLDAAVSDSASATIDALAAAWSRYRVSLEAALVATVGVAASLTLSALATATATFTQQLAAVAAAGDAGVSASAAAMATAVARLYADALVDQATLLAAGMDAAHAQALIEIRLSLAAATHTP